MPRYLLREVEPKDLDGLLRLAKHLNSVNFPHDRASVERTIHAARRSVGRRAVPVPDGRFMFVLIEAGKRRPIGTSMIFGQHGTPEAPHVFYDVLEDERYSTTLDRHFRHTTLRLGFSYHGPSEIGALVLDPKLRSAGLGKPLSFVRFMFMAMYRGRFRDEVIAELMPPLLPDGRSRLWEHIGRRFTGLDYQAADKLSHVNKEFIISLFPMEMNATLLPEDVRALIGEVGEQTKGVRTMLERIGFRYVDRIDPFDGGPHLHAATDEITAVRDTRAATVAKARLSEADERWLLAKPGSRAHRRADRETDGAQRALIGVGRSTGPLKFRATVGAVRLRGSQAQLTPETVALIRVRTGDVVHVLPL